MFWLIADESLPPRKVINKIGGSVESIREMKRSHCIWLIKP